MDENTTERQGHSYAPEEIDFVLKCLIETDNNVKEAISLMRKVASNLEHEEQPIAQSFLTWMDGTKQKPKNRLIYDIRRWHYNRYLELILEIEGLKRILTIVKSGEDVNAQKTIEYIANVTKGKPAQKVEVTGFVKHEDVQKAIEGQQTMLPDGQWVNPEEGLEEDQ